METYEYVAIMIAMMAFIMTIIGIIVDLLLVIINKSAKK